MELYSVAFLLFVSFFLVLHEVVGRIKAEYQWIVRLMASISFYFVLARWRIIALAFSVVSVWLAAKCIDKVSTAGRKARKEGGLSKEEKKRDKQNEIRKKRWILFLTIALNLILLIAIKYILPGMKTSIILPLGISFYTFMAISYLLDVYGEKYVADDNLGHIALYLSWFPQMLQGPINRYDYVKDSLFGKNKLEYDTFRKSFILFLFGACKKYALANILAPCVNEIFFRDNLSDVPGSVLLFIAFLFAIEQYADFSGGIDMVLAVSMLFGVRMNENFRQPYFSKSISEFWRRWHISLGSFLRDYVFYPFALLPSMTKLNKKLSTRFDKRAARCAVAGLGNIVVFLLVGLWHGSEMHYVLWGLYNGLIIVLSDFFEPVFIKIKAFFCIKNDSKLFSLFQIVRTFILIVFAGYFDAVERVSNGLICFKNTFTSFRINEFSRWTDYLYDCNLISFLGIIVAVIAFLIVIFFSLLKEKGVDFSSYILKKPLLFRWVAYFALIYVLLFGFASASGGGGFMYAAF